MSKTNKLDRLIAIYIFCIAVSELMGSKTFALATIGTFHLNASMGIFVIPLIYAINDIITEVYGKDRAKSVIRSGLWVIFLIFLYSLLAISLPPSARFLSSEKAYDLIFLKSARISAASLIAFASADFLDVYIFSRIKEKFGKNRLWLRTNVANITSEFVDTTVFITLAFYALNLSFANNFSFLAGIILPYWLLKCFMSVIETPFVYVGTSWLRIGDKENVRDS